ncbi:MAG: hydrogenase 4 subunit B [Betaproteobacteria bacterium]|nr:MAG: hydrogenase 4 subunit B [Betaproteobacteria bacterium]
MNLAAFPSAEAAVGIGVSWLALGALSLLESERARFITRLVFPASALISFVLAAVSLSAVGTPAQTFVLPLGLPDLPFHVRLDSLSALFLFLLGICSLGINIYASGYFRGEAAGKLKLLTLQYHCFLASMAFVLLADDAYMFMVAWETMALASYFLVITEHRQSAIRRAGFIYVLLAHIGAISILLCFGVLQDGGFEGYSFDALRGVELTPFWASVAFLLALTGFGAKAGMIPLHIWLPEAHPAAPSPVSALMSGVMLKTAIYALIRVTFDLIGSPLWQWGLLVAVIGALTALFGILYALQQNDLKRLLAYSSVENIGVILIGLGLAMIFFAAGHPEAGALGLIAALYHALNHGVYKSLLFLGAGSVLHSTGIRSLNEMGGLIHRMPHVAFYFLIGALAISALPPLNGFASEWLIFQTALQAGQLGNGVLRSVVPLLAAMLALAAALTARCFVKAFGIAFLGQPRGKVAALAQGEGHEHLDAGVCERLGMAWLAIWCVLLGIFPSTVVGVINEVCIAVTGAGLPRSALGAGVLWLVPSTQAQASYGPIVFLIVIAAVVLVTYVAVRGAFHGRIRRAPPWDCGYPEQTARMQDSSEGFGQSIRVIFAPIFRISRRVPGPDDLQPKFEVQVEDKHWHGLYLPVARAIDYLSSKVGLLQQGRISIYLLYSFITLIALLVFAQ